MRDASKCGPLAFSPDGRILAMGGMDKVVRLWHLATGKEVGQLTGHQDTILSVVFSRSGDTLVSGSRDQTARCWKVSDFLKAGAAQAAHLEPVQADSLWAALSADDVAKAYDAMASLASDPAIAVTVIKKNLQPAVIEEKRIEQLILDLDAPQFVVRENAVKELENMGSLASPFFRKALDRGPSLELRTRIERLLEKAAKLSPGELQGLRAIEVLEQIGTSEAQKLIESLATGAEQSLFTQEAKASLIRLTAAK